MATGKASHPVGLSGSTRCYVIEDLIGVAYLDYVFIIDLVNIQTEHTFTLSLNKQTHCIPTKDSIVNIKGTLVISGSAGLDIS
jgi:hypothetical protein